jgi:Bax protein
LKNSKSIVNATIFVLIIALLLESLYIVQLNTKLDRTVGELVTLQSQKRDFSSDVEFVEELRTPVVQEKKEDTTVVSILTNENKREEVEKKYDTALSNTSTSSEHFFKIHPHVDEEGIKKRYKKSRTIAKSSVDLSKLSVKEKKDRFISIVLPAIYESRNKLLATYENILEIKDRNMSEGKMPIEDEEYLTILYKTYRIKHGDIDSLLIAIKPHPVSVVLAQAALASGWGTSRFFLEGGNIFSIISIDDREDRMKVSAGNVYMKKYDSLVESVDDYMILLGRADNYSEFRNMRAYTDNPFELIKYLEPYSELRKEYVKRLDQTIRYNKFRQYDEAVEGERKKGSFE